MDLHTITSNPLQINSSIFSQESRPETSAKVVIHSVIPSSPENEINEDQNKGSQLNVDDMAQNKQPNQSSNIYAKVSINQSEKSVFDKYVMNKTAADGLNKTHHL